MKKLLAEFKTFALRGNVLEMAVAVLVGNAFSRIVSSLVEGVVTPVLSPLLGVVNFLRLEFSVGGIAIRYGVFLQNIVDFLIIAVVVFVFIQVINRARR